jgi:dTDP-6-deoxy-L-talose 4-dehydrogenase (NAD+)
MKKVLVTGATGFIGNYVVNELLKNDCMVIASSSSIDKAKGFQWFSQVLYKAFDFTLFDDNIDYFNFFGKPDIVIHLAWEGLPFYKEAYHYEVNLPRHFQFISNLVRNGATDINITGTCFEYGMQEGKLSEDMPTHPDNYYAKAKDELRKHTETLQNSFSFSFKWIRLFYMYGKGQNPKSLLSQLDKALEANEEVFNMSGGEQVRDYLPVTKVADNIVKVALQKVVTGIINCCSGVPITVKELVQNYLKEKNRDIKLNLGFYPYPDYEPMAFWGDNKKLKLITDNERSN